MTHHIGPHRDGPALLSRQRGEERAIMGGHGSEHIVLGFLQEGEARQSKNFRLASLNNSGSWRIGMVSRCLVPALGLFSIGGWILAWCIRV